MLREASAVSVRYAVPVDAPDGLASGYHDWFYVVEPQGERPAGAIVAGDGRLLSRRSHGYAARVCVENRTGAPLPRAALLRVAAAAGRALEHTTDATSRPVRIVLGSAGTVEQVEASASPPARWQLAAMDTLHLDATRLQGASSRHAIDAAVERLLAPGAGRRAALPSEKPRAVPSRALFFESVMASELPHNAAEISQGVLHMLGALAPTAVTPIRVALKMPAGDPDGPLRGLDRLAVALADGPVHLVCLTLLEDYFEGAKRLIAELRRLGCQAHVAVGGVMPTLSPEHVAAHLADVSFICRGAGEYFVPQLAAINGLSDTSTPWSEAQCASFMAMDGLLAIDRAGRRLLAGNPGCTVRMDDLDALDLDLSHLEPRHVEGGIEISTARGCVHHCSFCSIMGRQRYQARSADAVIRMLEGYEARFGELFGDEIPVHAYRVHISDDDFGCDRRRAREILERLRHTPFRLSSVQLSVADLCRRDGRRLLPEPDLELLGGLAVDCFADASRPLPDSDLVSDYGPRRWSSYLQVGIESFSDTELRRLGKGYRVHHVRAMVDELARRALHLDAYVILSNSQTRAEDLLQSLEEMARLKLRHPRHFHVRYPTVPRLVSYFPSASHKRKVRAGTSDSLALRRLAQVPGYPEFDYPFVDHDVPCDPWVRSATAQSFVSDERRYTDSLVALRDCWLGRVAKLPAGAERTVGEQLVRRLDDAPRWLVFEWLDEVHRRHRDSGAAHDAEREQLAVATAEELLGPRRGWLPAFRRFGHEVAPRLVVIPTWQCELRCRYCYVAKQEGRAMTGETLERAVDLLLSSRRREVMLQFFGGEPLCRFDLVQHGIRYAAEQAEHLERSVRYVVSSNGYALDRRQLAWLAEYPVRLELSLDGTPETHNANRPARDRSVDSYLAGIATKVDAIHEAGLPYDVIMVVHRHDAARTAANFSHIADLGFRRIQINFGLGALWSEEQQRQLADQLFLLGEELRRRWRHGDSLVMVNLENKPLPMRLNGEITVDFDGTIYGGNGFLHETPHKRRFEMGHLDHLGGFDRYWLDAPSNEFLLEWTYPPEVTTNNLKVGRIMTSFVRWMQQQPVGPPRRSTPQPARDRELEGRRRTRRG